MNLNLSWVLIYKKYQRIKLYRLIQELKRKSSKEHRFTLISGKTQPNPENKSIPLPDQTQQKSEDPPLPNKKLESRLSEKHRYTTLPVKT